jgi:hypothetical protein
MRVLSTLSAGRADSPAQTDSAMTISRHALQCHCGRNGAQPASARAQRPGSPLADDVILCASELAANAAIHGHSRLPGGTFTVRAKINLGNYALIEVEDNGGPWTIAISDPARHHGLDIVRSLADEWGPARPPRWVRLRAAGVAVGPGARAPPPPGFR